VTLVNPPTTAEAAQAELDRLGLDVAAGAGFVRQMRLLSKYDRALARHCSRLVRQGRPAA
jgi:hypothetical protein